MHIKILSALLHQVGSITVLNQYINSESPDQTTIRVSAGRP